MSNEFWAKESGTIYRQMPDLARVFAYHRLFRFYPEGTPSAYNCLVPPPRIELGTY